MKYQQTLNWQRWRQLCQTIGINDNDAIRQEFNRIVVAYGEPHRAYHTAQHINECLDLLDWCIGEISTVSPTHAVSDPALEMALWYHDVVYQPQRSDNEQCSADQATAFLFAHGVASPERIASLIMVTGHLASSKSGKLSVPSELTAWMVDIDLAILAAPPQRFAQYEAQIRQEYAWVPEAVYRAKRQALLTQFLERPTIYQSVVFQQRFEHQAQKNLSSSISINSLS